jgi:biopolymer transport protein ExbB/TolQ
METNIHFINVFANFMHDGGIFMWFILTTWVIGFSICIERLIKLFHYDIDSSSFMNELQKFIINGDIKGGIKLCSNTRAVLPRVLKNGLKRANQSPEQIQNAIDATALEMIPKVEKRIGHLNFIANICTLLGLLGTVLGLILAFQAVAISDPVQKAQILTRGVSTAMNTTALGLMSAISIMILHAFINSKAEKIITEMDEFSIKLLDLLGTKKIINENDDNK